MSSQRNAAHAFFRRIDANNSTSHGRNASRNPTLFLSDNGSWASRRSRSENSFATPCSLLKISRRDGSLNRPNRNSRASCSRSKRDLMNWLCIFRSTKHSIRSFVPPHYRKSLRCEQSFDFRFALVHFGRNRAVDYAAACRSDQTTASPATTLPKRHCAIHAPY